MCTTLLLILLQVFSPSLNASPKEPSYVNPVIASNMPDPTVINANDGYFYVYATEKARKLPIYKSKDLVHWSFVGNAFEGVERPHFEPGASIWAPDIHYFGGHYVMYYAMSVWGGIETCGIGVATATRPEGPFVDHGKLLRSNEIGVTNSIDPCFVEDNGKKYLIWGSFHGIFGTELSQDGLTLSSTPTLFQVAGTAYEGVQIYKRKGYFYLFASVGSCCNGIESTYTTVVGRATNLKGPYLNKKGESMMTNNHQVLIHRNEKFVGTGHNSNLMTDQQGRTWMLLHAFDMDDPNGRRLILQEILWDKEDWPFVMTDSPAIRAASPSF